ncbi:S41 family peptidase [Aggregatilinea lenta]|uniref:S41 family peptidase n=1 Tax=Aggregatilinea lenta TaxID=913108 RepID=UPI0013C3429B|nr:S41 family peptidase [Aggregatilinea lenta]
MLTGLILAAFFLAGFVVRGQVPATAQSKQDTEFPLLSEVEQLVEDHYLRAIPDGHEMEYAAIRGYLGRLNDPYTFFNDPPVAQSESDVLAGQYGGIGARVRRDEMGNFVLFPVPDSPAEQAGIEQGDLLIAINGEPISADERTDVVDQMLRGEVGDGRGVTVTVTNPDQSETNEYFIEFAVVADPSVVWRLAQDNPAIGYIQIIRFTSRTPDELHGAIADLREQGMQALVLDLRGNAGGLLAESVEVASEFLDGGVIFYEKTRNSEQATETTQTGTATDLPLTVLVDGGTASAAELVAGAIKDRERGMLIGQKTYGKGSVQLIFRLSDDSSIHITSAEWFTPAHAALNGNGLDPDIAMIPAEDGRDVELGEALRQLTDQLAAPESS